MSESNKSSCMSRRTVLIAAAGAAPLLALGATGRQGGEDVADGGPLPGDAEGRQTVRRLQAVHRAERLQERRRNDRVDRLVRALGQEGGLTIQPENRH